MESLRPILEAARDNGTFVNFDMEQYSLKDLTIELFERCCEEIDFAGGLGRPGVFAQRRGRHQSA